MTESDNKIGDSGASALADAVKHLNKLEHLDLECTWVTGRWLLVPVANKAYMGAHIDTNCNLCTHF